jgi:hypothetical protein
MYQIFIINPSKGLSTSVQIPAFSEFNHVIYVFAYGLGANECGFDAAVTDDFGGECSEEGFALIGRFAEFGDAFTVTHFKGGCGRDCGGGYGVMALGDWG